MAKLEHKLQFGSWWARDYREIRRKVKRFYIEEEKENSLKRNNGLV